MSVTNEPFEPNSENKPIDTSEKLEVNEAASESTDEGQAEVQEDLSALLSEAQAKVAQYYDQLLRARADVENMRRRAQDDVAKARKYGTEGFAESLVPVRDSLEAALAQTDQTPESWREGVETTLKQLTAAFERNQLKEVAPATGDRFDPHVHQAISSIPADLPEGAVVDLLQKGYMISDRVLRPALVTVSSGQAAA